jgi:hypothetical protein
MSRGLGPTQIRTLTILKDAPGLSVRELAARLERSEKYTRTVVTSLDERRLVIVRNEEGEPLYNERGDLIAARRHRRCVWLPEQLGEWQRQRMRERAHGELVRSMVYRLHRDDGICPCCGQALPKRPRPVK